MLEFKNVFKYFGSNLVLDNISFKIQSGELYLFVGENGSGKSTTFKLIVNAIFLRGKDRGYIQNDFKKIAYMPEKLEMPKLVKVYDYLKMIIRLYKTNDDILYYMERYKLENKYVFALSKGMLQKLGLIQMFLSKADLYLFDEAVDGLDEEAKRLFKEDIMLLTETGSTVIISTHQKVVFRGMKAHTLNFSNGALCKN